MPSFLVYNETRKGEMYMYNNPYYTNTQLSVDRIDNQIKDLENMRNQIQRNNSPAAINQTFQLAPTSGIRYVSTIEDVKREMVYVETPFFSKDLSVMWVKSPKGEIKSYELKEIVEKDNKDIQIEYLMSEIEELKGMIRNEQHNSVIDREHVSESTSDSDETAGEQTKDEQPSSVQRVSGSKKK